MASDVTTSKITLADGVNAHLYSPASTPIKGGVVICTDIFGIDKAGVQANGAKFAKEGYACIVPDCINDDPLDAEVVSKDSNALPNWLKIHPPQGEMAQNALKLSINHLSKTFSVKPSNMFVVGVCWGGKAILYALANSPTKEQLGGAMIAHGSFMEPTDFVDINVPVLLIWAEKDVHFNYTTFKEGTDILQAELKAAGKSPLCGSDENFKIHLMEGAYHGFWVDDDGDPVKQQSATDAMFKWANAIVSK